MCAGAVRLARCEAGTAGVGRLRLRGAAAPLVRQHAWGPEAACCAGAQPTHLSSALLLRLAMLSPAWGSDSREAWTSAMAPPAARLGWLLRPAGHAAARWQRGRWGGPARAVLHAELHNGPRARAGHGSSGSSSRRDGSNSFTAGACGRTPALPRLSGPAWRCPMAPRPRLASDAPQTAAGLIGFNQPCAGAPTPAEPRNARRTARRTHDLGRAAAMTGSHAAPMPRSISMDVACTQPLSPSPEARMHACSGTCRLLHVRLDAIAACRRAGVHSSACLGRSLVGRLVRSPAGEGQARSQ